jgi:rare lipoprotein A
MNALTAAHPTLPLPSIVEVTDLQNGRSLRLRVNDRGPFVDGRLIDVSRRAAQLLGFETNGAAPVRVRILKDESIAVAELAMRNGGEEMVAAAAAPVTASVAAAPFPALSAAARPPAPAIVATRNAAPEKPPYWWSLAASAGRHSARLYVQAGAFSMQDNAQRVRSHIAGLGNAEVTAALVDGIEMYRVRIGPVETADEADSLLARVVGSGYPGARIIGD